MTPPRKTSPFRRLKSVFAHRLSYKAAALFFALVLWFVYRQRLGVTRRRWLTASAVFVVAMVALPGWVLLVNSVATDGEPVAIEGQVLEKRSTSGKASSHSVRIHDDRTGATVKIHVTAPEYRALNVGDHFRRMFRTGRLGISYRWRLG